MDKIAAVAAIANLPVRELAEALEEFLVPVAEQLPDVRLRRWRVPSPGVIGQP